MRGFSALLAGLVFVAGTACATPERLTTSEDRVVAGTQTHLYVLRDLFDNQGSHYTALHDQHLVEIEVESGDATRFWPLRLMQVDTLTTDDLLMPGDVTERAGETHEMIAVLREIGAQPLIPSVWAAQDLSLVDGALMRDGAQLLTPFGIRAAGRAQLAVLRDYYPPIETEAEYRAAERIDFYDLYRDGDWECTLRPEGLSLFRAADSVVVAKIFCEDADLTGAWSFHILLPKEH